MIRKYTHAAGHKNFIDKFRLVCYDVHVFIPAVRE